LANVGSNKIVVAGKEFLLTGANDAVTRTLEFIYTVQPNDKTNADFYINSKDDIVLTGIQDTAGNSIDFGDISKGLDISPSSQNLALHQHPMGVRHNLMHHLNWYCRQSFLQYWKRCHWHANE
jgi:hypothetical protein